MAERFAYPATTAMPAGGVRLDRFVPSARFSLRMRESTAQALGGICGFELAMELNRMGLNETRCSARIGPDEWLLVATAPADARIVTSELTGALAPHFHSLVDVTHRQAGLILEGTHAADALNCGCALDLDSAAFPVRAATRTTLGKAAITLLRVSIYGWLIECGRSFVPYVGAFLENAARAFARGDRSSAS